MKGTVSLSTTAESCLLQADVAKAIRKHVDSRKWMTKHTNEDNMVFYVVGQGNEWELALNVLMEDELEMLGLKVEDDDNADSEFNNGNA